MSDRNSRLGDIWLVYIERVKNAYHLYNIQKQTSFEYLGLIARDTTQKTFAENRYLDRF